MSDDEGWYPGKFLKKLRGGNRTQSVGSVVVNLPGGFSIQKKEGLLEPFYLHNDSEGKEILTREGMFSFPLAYTGFLIAGPAGVLAGHVAGAIVGFVRNERIHSQ